MLPFLNLISGKSQRGKIMGDELAQDPDFDGKPLLQKRPELTPLPSTLSTIGCSPPKRESSAFMHDLAGKLTDLLMWTPKTTQILRDMGATQRDFVKQYFLAGYQAVIDTSSDEEMVRAIQKTLKLSSTKRRIDEQLKFVLKKFFKSLQDEKTDATGELTRRRPDRNDHPDFAVQRCREHIRVERLGPEGAAAT